MHEEIALILPSHLISMEPSEDLSRSAPEFTVAKAPFDSKAAEIRRLQCGSRFIIVSMWIKFII